MKDSLNTYKIWAPEGSVWSQWAKPVLFAQPPQGEVDLQSVELPWRPLYERQIMIIVDLPGKESVEEGLALAEAGYRPVPLYNGVNGPGIASSSLVDTQEIVRALFQGADRLQEMSIRNDAPPAFLLDSERMRGVGKHDESNAGKFDNRWCIFPQDMPSASFLRQQGIRQIVVYSDQIRNDLAHILKRYQEQGIRIHLNDGVKAQHEVTVVKPSRFKSLLYRFQAILGLTRHAAGGFGGFIPEATQSGSGGRFYGIG